jgi:glycosyltransferase involved in cell wall biosynthesis
MRIGLAPILSARGGGVYQYSLSMLNALSDWNRDEFVVFSDQTPDAGVVLPAGANWSFTSLYPPSRTHGLLSRARRLANEGPLRRWASYLRGTFPVNPDRVQHQPAVNRWFLRWGVEMMVYPKPHRLSFESGVASLMAIHDLQHRLQPEFPEVSANGEWARREYLFRNGARHATLLLADSEVGREDILNFYGSYGVTADRVKVLPFLPASYLSPEVPGSDRARVRETYRLPERYIFYPAQFWPHKNHLCILRALSLLKEQRHLQIPLVLCGSRAGAIRERTFREVIALSQRLGLQAQVQYLGIVPDENMSPLYAEAACLVMPTFFGPTNIPVLEAWAVGCPVLTSDIRGVREQAGDAAVLADPRSVEAIADGIARLWQSTGFSQTLVERGRKRLAAYTPEDYRRRLIEILEEAKSRVHANKGAPTHATS